MPSKNRRTRGLSQDSASGDNKKEDPEKKKIIPEEDKPTIDRADTLNESQSGDLQTTETQSQSGNTKDHSQEEVIPASTSDSAAGGQVDAEKKMEDKASKPTVTETSKDDNTSKDGKDKTDSKPTEKLDSEKASVAAKAAAAAAARRMSESKEETKEENINSGNQNTSTQNSTQDPAQNEQNQPLLENDGAVEAAADNSSSGLTLQQVQLDQNNRLVQNPNNMSQGNLSQQGNGSSSQNTSTPNLSGHLSANNPNNANNSGKLRSPGMLRAPNTPMGSPMNGGERGNLSSSDLRLRNSGMSNRGSPNGSIRGSIASNRAAGKESEVEQNVLTVHALQI